MTFTFYLKTNFNDITNGALSFTDSGRVIRIIVAHRIDKFGWFIINLELIASNARGC